MRPIRAALATIVGVVALIPIAIYIRIAIAQIFYPYEVDWLENGMVEHVRRVLDGHSIYAAPNADFVTFPYGPVTSYLGALVSWPFGASFWELRLLSTVAALGTMYLIGHIIHRETGRRAAALLGAGLYAASFGITGHWFSLAKPDSLFIFFMMLSLALVRGEPSRKRTIIAGLVMAVAVLTKQTALLTMVGLGVALLVINWRRALVFLSSAVAVIGVVSVVFGFFGGRWYWLFVWKLLLEHDEGQFSKWHVISQDLRPLWIVALVFVLTLPWWITRRENLKLLLIYGSVAVTFIVGAMASRLHSGGYVNTLMPAAVALALLGGLGIGIVSANLASAKEKTTLVTRWATTFLFILGLAQLNHLRYNVAQQSPRTADRAALDAAIDRIRAVDGDVLVAAHPTYAVMAGKNTHASLGGVFDINRAKDDKAKQSYAQSIAAAIDNGEFAAIVFDGTSGEDTLPADWKTKYHLDPTPLVTDPNALSRRGGWSPPPTALWLRN